MKTPFIPANILLPRNVDEKWPVVACDQFTSQPEYWASAESKVGDAYSTLNMILPEVYLNDNPEGRIKDINGNIEQYLSDGIFEEYKDAMIYVERTLPDGKVRKGIVAALDLEAYEFTPNTKALVRATEGTVLSRIPPRVEIRKDAAVELPHVMLLADDVKRSIIEPLSDIKERLQKVYDTNLMLGGGSIKGYLLDDDAKQNVIKAIEERQTQCGGFLFAVGDGNHSLATAKTCYEKAPNEYNRYALCELVNLYDEALEFEPIYRVVFGVSPEEVLDSLNSFIAETSKENGSDIRGFDLEYYHGENCGVIKATVGNNCPVPVGVLQDFLDNYTKTHPEAEVDYIHGEDVTKELSKKENTIGFIFPGMEKGELFSIVSRMGALPRKTFSMGEAASKRYYMECRKIK